MNTPIRILYIDDNPHDRELVRDALEREHSNFQLNVAVSKEEFEAKLQSGTYDLVLSDFHILGYEGYQVLDFINLHKPNLPVLIVTGTGSEEIAIESIKRGAADYVIKTPRHIQYLPLTITTVLEKKRL
ncbi:MAG: response regulator, partial [Ignavibacteriales bacterium]|nr:response regulator [Ignavibacteriales bacterium]